MHASFILGQILFAGVTFFTVRPNLTDAEPLAESTVTRLFAVSVVACVAALLLRRRVSVRPEGTSPDVFWSTAQQPALVAWIPLEAAGLFALVSYFESAAPVALAAAAIPVALLIALNPWRLERR
jgi:hypothetical protein